MKKNTNPHDLDEAEIAFLRSNSSVPDDVKGYLLRQHENIGTKISSYRKVAAAARAECDAILAVRDLAEAHGEAVTVAKIKAELSLVTQQNRALEAETNGLSRQLMAAKAEPALAVSSER